MARTPRKKTTGGKKAKARKPAGPAGRAGKSSLRKAAQEVAAKLVDAGYEALFAGGCVRDMAMKLEPKDYDIATDATPQVVQDLFAKTYAVGAQFGVVVVLHGKHQFEVATFRVDSEYSDGRHPDSVRFGDARADVMRRDFTINGMLYDPKKRKTIDYVEGQKDIKAKVIRCIGEPRQRFSEDKLRMLRAVRFSSRLGFEIEPATRTAIKELAPQIIAVSQERIKAELGQILAGKGAVEGIMQLRELGLLRYVLPEADAMAEVQLATETLLDHAMRVLGALGGRSFELALAAILHCAGGADERANANESARLASVAARRLKCSNSERSAVAWLVLNQHALEEPDKRKKSYLKRFFAGERFPGLLALFEAKSAAGCSSMQECKYVKKLFSGLGPKEISPEPFLTGNDLIEMGFKPSELFSVILDRVYDAQLDGEISDRHGSIELALKIVHER